MISSTTKSMEMLYSCKWNLPEASAYCGLSWDKTKKFEDYLTMKIDTQGMSYGTSETSTKSLEEQRCYSSCYPNRSKYSYRFLKERIKTTYQ